MSNLSQVQVGSTTYDLRDYYKTGVYFVKGTQTSSTGSWTGVLNGVSALYDGLTIAYFLPYGGDGNATLNLTLSSGATGAINCYFGTDRLSTQYNAGTVIYLTYFSAGSISINGTVTVDNRWIAQADAAGGDGGMVQYIVTNGIVGSASTGTAIAADDITGWTTNSPTQVAAKTVVTSASGATAGISYGVLTITNGSFGTGSSVTVTPGVAATLNYTARSIPNISVEPVTVVTDLTPTGVELPTIRQDPETRGLEIS